MFGTVIQRNSENVEKLYFALKLRECILFRFWFGKFIRYYCQKCKWTTQWRIWRKLRPQLNGPNGKVRIEFCKTNYGYASTAFQNAWKLFQKKIFVQANEREKSGTKAVMDCEKGCAKNGPIQKSPLISYNFQNHSSSCPKAFAPPEYDVLRYQLI